MKRHLKTIRKVILVRVISHRQIEREEVLQHQVKKKKTFRKIDMILTFVFSSIRDRFILINAETISGNISMTSKKVLLLYVLIIEMMCTYIWFPWILPDLLCDFFLRRQNERWSSMGDVVFSSSRSYTDISRLSYKDERVHFRRLDDLSFCIVMWWQTFQR